MAIADIYRATLNGFTSNQPTTMTLYFEETTATSLTPANAAKALAELLVDWWENNVTFIQTTESGLSSVEVNRIEPAKGPRRQATGQNQAVFGTVEADTLPGYAAAVTTFYTGDASKRGRGRAYLSGLPQTQVDGGVLTTNILADIQTAFTQLLTPFTGDPDGEWTWIVWSKTSLSAAIIEDVVTRVNLGTQRRRRSEAFFSPGVETP